MSIGSRAKTVLGRGKFVELLDVNGWEFVHRFASAGVVVIVATTEDGALVMVEQLRAPIGRRSIELPAGLVGDISGQEHESFALAAARELEEETGYRAARWSVLLDAPSSPGLSTEVVSFFRATGLERVGPGGGDETEDIVVHVISLPDVPAFLAQKMAEGVAIDPKVFAGLYFVDGAWPPGPSRTSSVASSVADRGAE